MLQTAKNVWHLGQQFLGHAYYGFPAKGLKLIGVTGTDGKTTTVSLIAHILSGCGKKVACISSVAAFIDGKQFDTGSHTTTPYRFHMPAYLRKMREKHVEYGVLEITSHGLDQHRAFGITFVVSAITNITHEHLDYHKTFERYRESKASIIKQSESVVLNADDFSFTYLRAYARDRGVPAVSFGRGKDVGLRVHTIDLTASGSSFTISDGSADYPVTTRLIGMFNVYNALAALAVVKILGVPLQQTTAVVASFPGVPGRMEVIDEGQKFSCIVDFAHTPNALEQVLKLVRTLTRGRVIVVFGSAGERDASKRPMLGNVAQQFADLVVITAEDPRSESVDTIAAHIAQGALKARGVLNKSFWMIEDRREAIRFAILRLAKPTDTVIVTGKGHEKTLAIGSADMPWSDVEEVRKALAIRVQEKHGL